MGIFWNLLSTNANRYSTRVSTPAAVIPNKTAIEIFDPGHGFTLNAGSGTLSDDTTEGNFISGSQSLKLVIDAADANDNDILNTSISPTWDFNGRFFGIVWKTSNPDIIDEARVNVGQDAGNSLNINIKSNFKNIFKEAGDWNFTAFDLSRPTQNGSRTAIDWCRIRFESDGSEEVTFWIDSIWAFDEPAEGTVVFMGDDTKESHFTKASPALLAHGFKGNFYLIAENLDGNDLLTTEQALKLQEFGHEICTHGTDSISGLTAPEVRSLLISMKSGLIDLGFKGVDHFSYPGGSQDKIAQEVCNEFFTTSRIAGSSLLTSPPSQPYLLGVKALDSTITTSDVTDDIDDAMNAKCPIFILFHEIVDSGATGQQYLTADFETIVDHCATNNYKVTTLSEYYEGLR